MGHGVLIGAAGPRAVGAAAGVVEVEAAVVVDFPAAAFPGAEEASAAEAPVAVGNGL